VADEITVDIPGLSAALAELRDLPGRVQKRILLGAAATGASVIRKEVILWAEKIAVTGELANAIYQVRLTQLANATTEVFKVGVRQGKKFRHTGSVNSKAGPTQGTARDAYYAAWVEYGHFARVSHQVGKDAKNAGRMLGVARWVPASPFFRPAVQAKTQDAFRAMTDYIHTQLPLAMAGMQYLRAA
jgi:hypothetical protein